MPLLYHSLAVDVCRVFSVSPAHAHMPIRPAYLSYSRVTRCVVFNLYIYMIIIHLYVHIVDIYILFFTIRNKLCAVQ